MTDPAAIDLGPIKTELRLNEIEASESEIDHRQSCWNLIAAVEALRERLTDAESFHDDAEKRAEAERASEVELAGVLEEFREHILEYVNVWEAKGGSHHHPIWTKVADRLAATLAKALERARATTEATAALRSYYVAENMADALPKGGRAAALHEIGVFLAKLNTLDQEDRT